MSAIPCSLLNICEQIRGKTHNEPTVLMIDILLQACLSRVSGRLGTSTLRTDLVVHYGLTDILY